MRTAKNKRTQKGSITLFSALTFFLVLALLFGLLENSRVYGLYANAYAKSELGVVSAYSNYAAEIAETFGILTFWEDGGDMEDMLLSCVEKQTRDEDNLILSLSSPSVDVDKKIYITEEGGIYFLKQIAELVPYRIGGEAISDILSLSDIQSQMSLINDFTQMIKDAQGNFTEIGEALDSVKNAVSAVRSMKSVIESSLESVETAASDLESVLSSLSDTLQETPELLSDAETFWESARASWESARETLLQMVKSVQTSINSALECMETFESLQETAADALDTMEELLDSFKDSISSSMYSELSDQIQTMRETFTVTDKDTYGRVELKNALTKAKELADGLVTKIEACEMPEFSQIEEKIRSQTQEEAEEYLKSLAQQAGSGLAESVLEFTESISTIIYNDTDTETSDAQTKGLTTEILEKITDLANNGIFALVLEDAGSVSTLTVSLSELPGKTSKSSGADQKTFLKSVWNRALMAAYSKLYFGSYTEPAEDSAIAYEMEYILGGSASDRTNLSTVMGEIFLIREGINYAYLLTDSAKMQEAGAVALAIATAVGFPILKIPIQMLLLAAWAAAESVCDLQQLYRGESVSLVKTSAGWNLSIENLADAADGTLHAGTSKSTGTSDSGYLSFDYETYLLILLLLQDGQTQTYRMMDVIQMRMQKSVRSDFYIKDCVVYTEGSISYRSAALFSDTWVLQQLLSVPSDYTISTAFSYGYVE